MTVHGASIKQDSKHETLTKLSQLLLGIRQTPPVACSDLLLIEPRWDVQHELSNQ